MTGFSFSSRFDLGCIYIHCFSLVWIESQLKIGKRNKDVPMQV